MSSKIPEVNERGIHNIVVHNPFGYPEKELERDERTGLLRVKNGLFW